jgi:hypothetical protein
VGPPGFSCPIEDSVGVLDHPRRRRVAVETTLWCAVEFVESG